jgi:hypothetical protein
VKLNKYDILLTTDFCTNIMVTVDEAKLFLLLFIQILTLILGYNFKCFTTVYFFVCVLMMSVYPVVPKLL